MPKLILVGGWEWVKDDGVDDYIAKLAKGKIGLIPHASKEPGRKIQEMTQKYNQFGATPRVVDSADDLIGLNVIYLSGGHPDLLMQSLSKLELAEPLKANWLAGGIVIAGSSSGAMVMFPKMMAHGSRMKGDVELTDGLGYVGGAILVPHWDTADEDWKKRFRKTHEAKGIIAIDEHTALIWEDGKEKILGLGKVYKFGPAEIRISQ
ncbi:Type 1 glutamine amidotransferase-like domain-containing protein [Candidatus Microgenomates bacterium]|nr:Type 1 glutamine amidotransferase-like domain-containing protein [Candidatus Microgenomates bacterium]